MLSELKELWRYRELLLVMVQRDLKIRYKNSALGFLWSFLNPLLTVAVMTFVYANFIFRDQPNMGAYIMAAYLPFMFFQQSIMDSSQSVVAAVALIKKIYFPRELLPLAAVLSNFVNFLFALAIFFAYLLINYALNPGSFPIQATVYLLPLLIVFSLALALGGSLIVSALNAFYEDVKYVVSILLYLLFFICPIVYFDETVANSKLNLNSGWLTYKIYNLNPIAHLCTAYKKAILAPYDPRMISPAGSIAEGVGQRIGEAHGPYAPVMSSFGTVSPDEIVQVGAIPLSWKYLAATGFTSFVVLLFGYWLFNRLKWRFVERP